MFHAACAASHRPGRNPTRGSGVGAVAETIGATGGGITAGGGGGGGFPRPAGAGGAIVSGAADGAAAAGGAAAGAGAGVLGAGVLGAAAADVGALGVVDGGGALGAAAGDPAFDPELAPHAVTPNIPAVSSNATRRAFTNSTRDVVNRLICDSPAFRSSG